MAQTIKEIGNAISSGVARAVISRNPALENTVESRLTRLIPDVSYRLDLQEEYVTHWKRQAAAGVRDAIQHKKELYLGDYFPHVLDTGNVNPTSTYYFLTPELTVTSPEHALHEFIPTIVSNLQAGLVTPSQETDVLSFFQEELSRLQQTKSRSDSFFVDISDQWRVTTRIQKLPNRYYSVQFALNVIPDQELTQENTTRQKQREKARVQAALSLEQMKQLATEATRKDYQTTQFYFRESITRNTVIDIDQAILETGLYKKLEPTDTELTWSTLPLPPTPIYVPIEKENDQASFVVAFEAADTGLVRLRGILNPEVVEENRKAFLQRMGIYMNDSISNPTYIFNNEENSVDYGSSSLTQAAIQRYMSTENRYPSSKWRKQAAMDMLPTYLKAIEGLHIPSEIYTKLQEWVKAKQEGGTIQFTDVMGQMSFADNEVWRLVMDKEEGSYHVFKSQMK